MEHHEGISNNEAEYLAIISALNNVVNKDSQIVILSDSQLVVNQINHKYGIRIMNKKCYPKFGSSKKNLTNSNFVGSAGRRTRQGNTDGSKNNIPTQTAYKV